jgi:hypothetical protein
MVMQLTDDFLEYHGLMEIRDAVMLIRCVVSPVNWRMELAKLTALPADMVDGVLSSMDQDHHT